MTRFFLLLSFFFSVCWLMLTYSGTLFYPAFEVATSNYRFLVVIVAAASYPLYTYTDSIQKDVISDFGRSRAKKSIEKLESLKKETLTNIFALFLLLVFHIFASSLRQSLTGFTGILSEIAKNTLLASEFSCFLMGVMIGVIQFLGFIRASEFRSVVSNRD